MRFTPGGDNFPSPCLFCGHVRNAEGVCQCPAGCPTCLPLPAGDTPPPWFQSCCGRAVVVEVRILPAGSHGAALIGLAWPAEGNLMNVRLRLQCECGWHVSADGPVSLEWLNEQLAGHPG